METQIQADVDTQQENKWICLRCFFWKEVTAALGLTGNDATLTDCQPGYEQLQRVRTQKKSTAFSTPLSTAAKVFPFQKTHAKTEPCDSRILGNRVLHSVTG